MSIVTQAQVLSPDEWGSCLAIWHLPNCTEHSGPFGLLTRGLGRHRHFSCMRKHMSFLKTWRGRYSTPVFLGLQRSPLCALLHQRTLFITTPPSVGWDSPLLACLPLNLHLGFSVNCNCLPWSNLLCTYYGISTKWHMNENHSKFAISASQWNLKLVSSESGHSSCLELPSKLPLLSDVLRLAFSKFGTPIHYTFPTICKNFSNSSVQDCCSASGVAQVSSLPLSRSWVYIKKIEEMASLSHKHFFFRLKFLPYLESRWKVHFSPPLKKTNNMVSLKYFLLIILKYFISVSMFILKKNTQETETALFKLYKWGVSDNFKSFLMQAHAELRDLSSLTLFCKQFQWTDASGKNNSLKKFPKPLMYITENRHWSLSYKNLASDDLLLFFRSFSFHNRAVLQKAVVHIQFYPRVTSKHFWLSSLFVYLFSLMQPQCAAPEGTGALEIVETIRKIEESTHKATSQL